ncbi:hypothetical protein AVEN_120161-1 [Araneus ventricosus]|uniref:Uncharacterized protein n=1 Tax=Araneus ventricosus TaxID=182803 RepID=A0A4Y2MRE3_ARAVE|nr:hypothetical protein AVEN_120161-1 [Araneus ventricosus]
MESRFPAMLVLWLGREFYRGKYGNGAIDPDFGEKLGYPFGDTFDDFGDEMWDLKSTGIFLISLLRAEIAFVWITSRPVGETIKGPCSGRRGIMCVDRLGSPLECKRLWNLSLEFYPLCELVSC